MINLNKKKPLFVVYSDWGAVVPLICFVLLIGMIFTIPNFWGQNRYYNLFVLLGFTFGYLTVVISLIYLVSHPKFKTIEIVFWDEFLIIRGSRKIFYTDIQEISQKIIYSNRKHRYESYIDDMMLRVDFIDIHVLKYILNRNEQSKHIKLSQIDVKQLWNFDIKSEKKYL